MGLKVYPSLGEIPGTLDLAVIVVPAQFVPGVLRDAAAKGATICAENNKGGTKKSLSFSVNPLLPFSSL